MKKNGSTRFIPLQEESIHFYYFVVAIHSQRVVSRVLQTNIFSNAVSESLMQLQVGVGAFTLKRAQHETEKNENVQRENSHELMLVVVLGSHKQ